MKHPTPKQYSILSASFLTLLLANSASAQTVPEDPTSLVGSDSLNSLLDALLPGVLERAPEGVRIYDGLGSKVGQRQMEGRVLSGDPACGFEGSGDNPGCQEIAPMGSLMSSQICDDAEAAGEAESLLVGFDAMVLLTDSAAHQQMSVGQCSAEVSPSPNAGGSFVDNGTGHLRTSGSLPVTGYVLGENFAAGDEWMDAVRLLYTGCEHDDGACTERPRSERCDSEVRRELLGSWNLLFDGEDCGTGACSQLRHALRPDDSSGLASALLERIGIDASGMVARQTALNGGGFPAQVGDVPESFPYCDGGMEEQYAPSVNGSDPIRVDCETDADLCGADGTSGIVQVVRSVGRLSYPTQQCGRNRFARVAWSNTTQSVCPDGSVPVAGRCNLPFREVGGVRDFNCINLHNSRPATLGTIDGRVYNSVQRDSAGNVHFIGNALPVFASHRQNMVNVDTGFAALNGKSYAVTDAVCQAPDATRAIGCVIAQGSCNIGLAGRGAAASGPNSLAQEPLFVGTATPSNENVLSGDYPLTRGLYIGAIGGFETINEDCEERGHADIPGASDYCFAQYEVAIAAHTMPPPLRGAIGALGYVAITADFPGRCVGAQQSAGCGAPTEQPLEACLPTRPADREEQ